ncbi:MAG: Hint domain-containing protein [Litoreibacter sp.]
MVEYISDQEHTQLRHAERRAPSILHLSGAGLTIGTQILTEFGDVPVEGLKPGDMVIGESHQAQKLNYIAFQDVDLLTCPELAPICISDPKCPDNASTYFAPCQALVLRHPMFRSLFGNPEVEVECRHLADLPGAKVERDLRSITYVALGFSQNQSIYCNGILAHSRPQASAGPRPSLGQEESALAWRLVNLQLGQAKRHGFPLQ